MRSYSRSSLGLIGLNAGYSLLGLAQAMVVAAVFGAGREYDLYLVAQTLPELWIFLLAGLLQSGFMPGYLRTDAARGAAEGWRLRWASVGLVMVASSLLIICLGLAAPWAVRLLAPGFPAQSVPECAALFRLLLVTAWISSLVRLLVNLHQADRSFIVPAASHLCVPATIIATVLIWGRSWGIEALWLGLSLGVAIQVLVLLPRIRRDGKTCKPKFRLWHPDLGRIMAVSWPLILGVLANRINFAVDRAVASTLNWGDISALRYAFLIVATATMVFSFPFTQTLFPRLCRLAEAGRMREMSKYLGGLTQFYFLFFMPAMGLALLFSGEAVELVFHRGAFTAESVAATGRALVCYAPCLIFLPLVNLVGGIYASLQRTRSLSTVAGTAVILNLAADLILAPRLGLAGIALATSIIQALWAFILYAWLARLEPGILHRAGLGFCGWCLGLICLLAAALVIVLRTVEPGLTGKIAITLAALAVYGLAAAATRRGRLKDLWLMFRETET